MVQVEAMLCGTPVVASNMPGVREVVKRTGYGLLSKQRQSEDIARKISEVFKNRKKFAPNRERVSELFGMHNIIKEYDKLFGKEFIKDKDKERKQEEIISSKK